MKLVWLTDIHLNFLDESARKNFYKEIISTDGDGVLISGDIAEAPSLIQLLNEMAIALKKPIYFVLGNHDYYGGTIADVREKMYALTQKENNLYWLPACGIVSLNDNILLVGQDGWADGRLGNYQNSHVTLNDEHLIGDLFQAKILGRFELLEKMQQLADKDAMRLNHDLTAAVKQNPKKIIIVTHIPPFREACVYKGKISDDNWMPYFSSKTMGNLLEKIARKNPNIEFLVLCGHTHSEAYYRPMTNLIIKAGKAKYSQPSVQQILHIEPYIEKHSIKIDGSCLGEKTTNSFGLPGVGASEIDLRQYAQDADGFWFYASNFSTGKIFLTSETRQVANQVQASCATKQLETKLLTHWVALLLFLCFANYIGKSIGKKTTQGLTHTLKSAYTFFTIRGSNAFARKSSHDKKCKPI